MDRNFKQKKKTVNFKVKVKFLEQINSSHDSFDYLLLKEQ